MKKRIMTSAIVFLGSIGLAIGAPKSAIVADTPLTLTIRARQVLNIHQYYHQSGSSGFRITIQIGEAFIDGITSKNLAADQDAAVWPERRFKVAGPAQVLIPGPIGDKLFITYSIDPR
jgi:hypothetical protein